MFLLTLANDGKTNQLLARGAAHYSRLYERFLNTELLQEIYDFGPIHLRVLGRADNRQELVICDENRFVGIMGHPSMLQSARTTVTKFISEFLADRQFNIETVITKLQGDFVAILADKRTGQWQVAGDAMGLGRLYLCEKNHQLILADKLFLIGSCVPCEIDPVASYSIDLCDYIFGDLTLFKGVRFIGAPEMVKGHSDRWSRTVKPYFANLETGLVKEQDVIDAYLDAARPRFEAVRSVRHCLSGGSDSRLVLALIVGTGVRPTVYSYRWDPEELHVAHMAANQVALEFLSSSREVLFADTPEKSLLAEAFVLDGGLRVPLQMRGYLFGLTERDLLTTGHFSEGLTRVFWVSLYAGMSSPSHRKVIDRAVVRFPRKDYQRSLFPEDPTSMVQEYLRQVLTAQSSLVRDLDHVKFVQYIYLRNRGARWAAQSADAVGHFTQIDYPAAYTAGAALAWLLPASAYTNYGFVRTFINAIEPRLGQIDFVDGFPARIDWDFRDQLRFYRARCSRGITFIKEDMLGLKRSPFVPLGNASRTIEPRAFWTYLPRWSVGDSKRRLTDIYQPFEANVETTSVQHLKSLFVSEFASRIHDAEF